MKKFLVLAMICVATLSVQAQKATTDEQKAVKKEMLEKYDTNKDGKLDKEERSKMSAEDKAKWAKAFPKKKKTDDGTPVPAPADPAK
ncbi:MAG: hypothetical protein JWQ04_1182 [Pedosphaera sp.]|nr:hypothetical protein [Pedosphaera sp.]